LPEETGDAGRVGFRIEVLRAFGASDEWLEPLLAYTRNPYRLEGLSHLPLEDEPHVAAWQEYERDARSAGAFEALAKRIVQLRFPVSAGISRTEAYQAATRRGVGPEPGAPGLALERPQDLVLTIEPTLAGRVPILIAGCRHDFVALVRACTARNEPEPVPDAMGACIVTGLNNWDRVARHRQAVEAERGGLLTPAEWAAELAALAPRKALYQDRFIILGGGPYSAVPASEIGLTEEDWLARSAAVRRAHECTHYFTLRALGHMRSNLFDELLADFAGLVAAFHRYDGRLALRFLGLDTFPHRRPGGRFELYLGAPPLPAPAIDALQRLTVAAAERLDRYAARLDLERPLAAPRMVAALSGLTLEELASDGLAARLDTRLSMLPTLA